MDNQYHPFFWFFNITSVASIVSTVLGFLPPIAAAFAALYYLVQVLESKHVQRWMRARRIRQAAKLRACALQLEAKAQALDIQN